jgi:hypothetical protein
LRIRHLNRFFGSYSLQLAKYDQLRYVIDKTGEFLSSDKRFLS